MKYKLGTIVKGTMQLHNIELVDPADCQDHKRCIKLYGDVEYVQPLTKLWPSSNTDKSPVPSLIKMWPTGNTDTGLWAEFIRQAVLAASDAGYDAETVGWNVGDDVMQIA